MGSRERQQQQQAGERFSLVLQSTCSVLASCWTWSQQLQLAGHAHPGPLKQQGTQKGCCVLEAGGAAWGCSNRRGTGTPLEDAWQVCVLSRLLMWFELWACPCAAADP